MMRKSIIMLGAGAALLTLAGCGGPDVEGTFETEDGESGSYSINEADGETSAVIETEDGKATLRSGKDVKVDLPDGFTLFSGAKVVNNTVFEQDGSKGSLIILESEAAPDDLAAHYRKEAEGAGIEIKLEMSVNGGKMIGGEDSDGRAFTFNANRNEDKTTAQLMVGDGFGK